MEGIVLATNRLTPMSGLINKFMKSLKAYANDNGMAYVADCIKNTEDLTRDDFQPEEINFSDCVQVVTTKKLDADANPILDLEENKLTEEVKLITRADRYDEKNEMRKYRMRFKEDEYRKFESDKKVCLSSAELQFCPGVHDILDTVPEYADIYIYIYKGISLAH